MTSEEAKMEGYVAGIRGRPSCLAPIGMHNLAWLRGWIQGRVARSKLTQKTH